jgi:beta-N-acetylhexosaminidase
VIRELRSVPRATSATVVLGAALLTIALLAAFDSLTGSGAPDAPPAPHAKPAVVRLDPPPGRPPKQQSPPAATPAERQPKARSGVPTRELVGARIAARMDGAAPSEGLLGQARRGEIGAVIVFPNGASGSSVAAGINRLQASAQAGGQSPLIVATDQEGGIVKRFPGAPPSRSASVMGAGSASQARAEGSATGAGLSAIGINADFAPVMDVASVPGAFIGTRSFGGDPSLVASRATAFATGLQDAGVAATAKHFPGLGSATVNTDLKPSVVSASASSLRAQLKPFQRAIDAGIRMVMVGSAIYPAYDANTPAVMSKTVVDGTLRGELGFGGVVVTDDLQAPAISSVRSPGQAAVAAAGAGADLLLFAQTAAGSQAAFDAMLAAARSGQLDRGRLEESYNRIDGLRSALSG